MAKKHRGLVALIIINVIIIVLVSAYHYLQVHYFYTDKIYMWLRKIFQKEVSVYKLIYDKRLQYILLSLMYVALFCLIIKFSNKLRTRKVIAVIASLVYSLHIFVNDTLINYRRFYENYHRLSDLTFPEFSISSIWNNAISTKYGFFIILINAAFMCSILFLIILMKSYEVEGDDFDWLFDEEDDDDEPNISEKKSNSPKNKKSISLLADYSEYDIGAVRIVELYANDAIGYKAVVDYIDGLAPNDLNGLRSLMLIENMIAECHPVIAAAVKKAKTTKYRKMIETLGFNDKDKGKKDADDKEMSKVINYEFNKNNDRKND